ncbi:hypothetical protein PYW08_011201 [Mythimna loreyi]|uniref:Uncharacterized protein n=1 Tax=Mythimna loreyi TaxID=667449 RepID=A0ACC2Q3H5_9NEOP|nr:hypothetical protein PYW08_011201 [Mythimna loreyi]
MTVFWSLCLFLTLISLATTQQINANSCQLPVDPGNCGVLAYLSTPAIRYGYDRNSANCVQFTYTGCGGNTNRFSTYNQCLTTCYYSQGTSLNQLVNLFGAIVNQFT